MDNKALAIEIIDMFKQCKTNDWYCLVFNNQEYDSFEGFKDSNRTMLDYIDNNHKRFYENTITKANTDIWMITDGEVNTILNDCPIDIDSKINNLDNAYKDDRYIELTTELCKGYNDIARKFRRVLRKHGYTYKMIDGKVLFYNREV